MPVRTRNLVVTALFIACVVVVGYAFVYVPNVELVTATVFLSGMILGPRRGLLVGALGESLYSLLNPIGMAAPPLLVAQVIAMATAGFAGGFFRASGARARPRRRVALAAAGFALTFLFDFLTTLGFLVVAGFSLARLWSAYAYGAVFYSIHLFGNVFVFAVVLPAAVHVLNRISLPDSLRPQQSGYPTG